MKRIFTLLALATLIACQPNTKNEEPVHGADSTPTPSPVKSSKPKASNDFVQKVETAHKVDEFYTKEAISFDIELFFGGNLVADGTVSMLTNSGKIKLATKDGATVLFDGKDTYVSINEGANYSEKRARFDIFTWQYFFALPYKLSDPGTSWELTGEQSLNETSYQTGKLTFGENIGDAPDDWYLIYSDDKDLIYSAAYIVTYSGDVEKAESDPHAITYEDYQTVEGIPFATKWKFWGWQQDKGLTDQLGNATISNIQFKSASEANFNIPENATKVEK